MSYNSKYTGTQVEEFLDQIANGEIGGGITEETDPIFSASPAASITEVKKTEWDGKQDAIADLDTIRSGAALGATALQRIDYSQLEDNLIDSGFYHSPDGMLYRSDMEDAVQESLNKADSALQSENDPIFSASPAASITEAKKAEWDNKVDKVSGKQLSTEDFTSALKTKLEGLSNYDDTELSEAISTLRGDFDKLVSGDTTTAIKTFNEVIAFLDGVQDTQDLSSIIASIEQQIAAKQDEITDLATIRSGAAKGATALQSYTEKYTGTITGIKMNGTSKGTSGVVDLGTVITSHQDISGKQDRLVSGTNIKTINGASILGSGNITISGGGGSSSGAYSEVNHGTSDTTFALTPNTFHVWDEVSALTLTLGSETAGVANEFLFQFTSGATTTSLSLPDDIKWANGAPDIVKNKIYQISILNGLAVYLEFGNATNLPVNKATWVEGDFSSGGTLTFQYPVASDLTILFNATAAPYTIYEGEQSINVRWDEPIAPSPYSIVPESDDTYIYEL